MKNQNDLKGLGGWLILVGIGVIFSPIRLLVSYVPLYYQILSDGTWEALTTVGSEAYNPLWEPILMGEIVYNLGIFVLSIYLIYFFFSKHYLFPRFYIALLLAPIIFIPMDAWVVTLVLPNEPMFDPEAAKEFARALIGAFIWVPYLFISKRVQVTFVEKMQNNQMQPTAESVG